MLPDQDGINPFHFLDPFPALSGNARELHINHSALNSTAWPVDWDMLQA